MDVRSDVVRINALAQQVYDLRNGNRDNLVRQRERVTQLFPRNAAQAATLIDREIASIDEEVAEKQAEIRALKLRINAALRPLGLYLYEDEDGAYDACFDFTGQIVSLGGDDEWN